MFKSPALLAFLLAAALPCALRAQAAFECYPLGPFPLPGPANCENLLCNNLGLTGLTGVTSTPACGMPTQGSRYARLEASGPFTVPAGGPPSYPLPNVVTELRIPIPAGAATVELCWDFYNAEGPGSFLNDGMAIAVVDASGNLVQLLAYADASSPPGICADTLTFLAVEVAPNGPQGLSAALPALTGGEYLSVACWNGIDNAVASHAKIDDVRFNSGLPSCPVPPPPPSNDACQNPVVIGLGSNGPFSNLLATNGATSASCASPADTKDLWFQFTPACTGAYAIDTCGASFNTVLSVLGGCGGPEIACNDDDASGTCPAFTDSRIVLYATAGTSYLVRVAGNVLGGTAGTFNLNVTRLMLFLFTSAGAGTAGFQITGGPPGGLYFAAITLNAGNFPNGSFFGIDIGLQELANEFNGGYPFTGPLGACGEASFGPMGGLPSGLGAFGTALGFPGPAYWLPASVSVVPASIIVP